MGEPQEALVLHPGEGSDEPPVAVEAVGDRQEHVNPPDTEPQRVV